MALDMARSPPDTLVISHFAAFLHSVVLYCPEYFNVPAADSRTFLKVFSQLLNKGKDEDGSDVAGGAGYSAGVATVILRAANLLVRSSVYDCRREVCALGESCTAAVIAQFDSRGGRMGQANEANAAVVQFLNLQLSCHNPAGAVTRGEGAAWGGSSEDAWLSCLVRVYGNLVDANIANGVRNLRVKGGGSGIGGGAADIFQLDPELVRLCASVCHQLLARRETAETAEGGGAGSITATQIVQLDTTQTQAAGRGKSRDGFISRVCLI